MRCSCDGRLVGALAIGGGATAELTLNHEVDNEEASVPDMILHLRSLLRNTTDSEPLYILPLFERQRSVRAMIAMFLAVLELVKRQAVALVQKEMFGEIALKKHRLFEESLASDEAITEEVEKDYK